MIEINIISLLGTACLCRFQGIQNNIWPDYFIQIIAAIIYPGFFMVFS